MYIYLKEGFIKRILTDCDYSVKRVFITKIFKNQSIFYLQPVDKKKILCYYSICKVNKFVIIDLRCKDRFKEVA